MPKTSSASTPMPTSTHKTTLTISSKNYSSWSLRGWLLVRFAGLAFDEVQVATDDADARAEILLLAPSILVPCLRHQGVTVWDTLAIAEYLHEIKPKAGLLPADRAARAHCRAICGEMHSGFVSLRSALPMNLKGSYPGFKVWSRAQSDIQRVLAIWQECLATYGGPFLFGERSMADAMYAPVVTRLHTYDVAVPDAASRDWCARMLALPEMQEWTAAALLEPEEIDELEAEF
jgi:glutathione S-transferase